MNKTLRLVQTIVAAVSIGAMATVFSGCESDDDYEHKITFHNKSSHTVTQSISGYGTITIKPGDKKAFGDDSLSMYGYQPSATVIRVQENSHTVVYKDR